uniref:DUF2129 domain-containing protein n=1 Tax=Heterorhabditis bacteriophora TaxID=37862 RepID=A0A1I7WG89_HETBA
MTATTVVKSVYYAIGNQHNRFVQTTRVRIIRISSIHVQKCPQSGTALHPKEFIYIVPRTPTYKDVLLGVFSKLDHIAKSIEFISGEFDSQIFLFQKSEICCRHS